MDYLINKNRSITDIKDNYCECCNKVYQTNINRTRCSIKCSKIMKHRRRKTNNSISKRTKEKKTYINTNVFGFVQKYYK